MSRLGYQRARDFQNEFSAAHNIRREYLEEVFNKGCLQTPGKLATYDWFYKDPDLVFLNSTIEDDGAEICLTGLSVDTISLRSEILALLLIRSPDWWENHKGCI